MIFQIKNSPFRFTLPKLEILADSFKKKGIGSDHHVILYSRNGTQWSARIWWMLRAVGFDRASILDGGFCLLYTSPSPRDVSRSRMPSSA